MSVLASFTGNQFNDGGVIAAARTRASYTFTGQPYESLTQLQDHSYNGPIKTGAYAWWLPYSIEELEFRDFFEQTLGTELRMAGIFEDAAGQLKISLAMTVEFYSPLQIFEHEPGPPLTDAFIQAYHALDHFPACTCNPSHSNILKGILSRAAKAAKGGGNFLLKHPEIVTALFAAL
jgi:hypothetical protein